MSNSFDPLKASVVARAPTGELLAQGPPGPKGATGPQGPQGATGPAAAAPTYKLVTNAISPYTMLATDGLIDVDPSAGPVTVKLPPVVDVAIKRTLKIKNITNTITLDGNGNNVENPDNLTNYGATGTITKMAGESVVVVGNGSVWEIV